MKLAAFAFTLLLPLTPVLQAAPAVKKAVSPALNPTQVVYFFDRVGYNSDTKKIITCVEKLAHADQDLFVSKIDPIATTFDDQRKRIIVLQSQTTPECNYQCMWNKKAKDMFYKSVRQHLLFRLKPEVSKSFAACSGIPAPAPVDFKDVKQ